MVSGALALYSEMILLIIASRDSSETASALASGSGVAVCILAESADLGWFMGSLALKRWIRWQYSSQVLRMRRCWGFG